MEPIEDGELLQRWRDGDADAGGELFERYFHAVFRFFASKLDEGPARDLTQKTFLAVVESRERIKDGMRIRAYVFTVARRELLMFFRARGRRGVDAELSQSCVDELAPSPSMALVLGEEERQVVGALRRISLEQQMLLELHYWEELGMQELAELLEIPVGTVKSRLSRARDAVRRVLAEIAVDPALANGSVQDFEAWLLRLRDARA